MRNVLPIAVPGILILLGACSSSPKDDSEPNGTTELPLCGGDPTNQPDRCIDAKGAERCRVDSGFPGDELALCDMDPEDGFVVHFGPSDYSDPEEVAKYVLPAGGEEEFCFRANTPNTSRKFFNSYHGRMRPNSHHLIVTMPADHHEGDTAPWPCGPQVTERWLFGSQDPQIDVGVGADPALPEPGDPDYGLAHDIPANQTLMMDFHNLNATDHAELREAWASLRYVDESEVLVHADLIGFYNVGISIPPMAHKTTSRMRCDAPKDENGVAQEVYLNVVTGHAHQRMQRFSVWHERSDGSSDLIYETTDWLEPGNALYRDGIDNPPLPLGSRGEAWGAKSGYLKVKPGEAISFECEFQNDLPHVVTMGETSKDEMCNVFGNYFPSTGAMWNCFGS